MYFFAKAEGPAAIHNGTPEGFEKYNILEATRFYYEGKRHITFSQRIHLPGCTLWCHVISTTQAEDIAATARKSGIRLNFILGAKDADAALNQLEQVQLISGKADMFYVLKGAHEAQLPAGTHIYFHLDLKEKLLQSLEQDKKYASLVRAIKQARENGRGQINSVPVGINVYCATLIEEIRQQPYRGFAAKVYMKKKAMLLLEYFAQHFIQAPEKEPAQLTPHDVNITDKAKAYLKQNMYERFSLSKLEEGLHISNPQRLARHFKQLNEISLYEFDRYYRMEAAFQRVAQTTFTISFIAHIFGYNSTSAFSRAFSEYFGIKPSALRRAKK